ncbi:unnamed protein product [Rhizophagus irregularis]|uniref:Uncharacterized protein n=1 Tax=Rhizophagus irregularis TaxID=588596 RepID=A0A915ZPW7_9GLOM|nr:unnamed protein product [Rhizophagus irregularis]CAB5197543.1 unnamed protein product [Rhizophagus irregularis]CAB5383150.1 unnamed protein product [Rhizophagus irregularis]
MEGRGNEDERKGNDKKDKKDPRCFIKQFQLLQNKEWCQKIILSPHDSNNLVIMNIGAESRKRRIDENKVDEQ